MEAKLITKLDVEHVEGTMLWLVTAEFQFQSAVLNRIVIVPDGFLTDFNSIPRPLWSILPPHENPESGVVHDWLYKYNGCTKTQADQTHREVLEVINNAFPGQAPHWKRMAMYSGLTIGGGPTWNKYRREQQEREVKEATAKLDAISSGKSAPI